MFRKWAFWVLLIIILFLFILAQGVEPSADEGCVVIDSDIDDHESDEDTVCVLYYKSVCVGAN